MSAWHNFNSNRVRMERAKQFQAALQRGKKQTARIVFMSRAANTVRILRGRVMCEYHPTAESWARLEMLTEQAARIAALKG